MIKVFIDDLKVVYKGFFVRGLKPLVKQGSGCWREVQL